jgi:hypothetical protein
MQKKVKATLSFDEKIYEKFKKFCDDNAIMLSKKLELEMEKIMDYKKEAKKNE